MANPGGADDTPSTKPSITLVIFDMDGLSLDTEKFYTEVQEIILSRYSQTFDWSLKAKMMGASRLILHLHATGIPICVATGRDELFSLMHHIVLGDDPEVKQGNRTHHQMCSLPQLKDSREDSIDPAKILVFEDAQSGVLAAKNASIFIGH